MSVSHIINTGGGGGDKACIEYPITAADLNAGTGTLVKNTGILVDSSTNPSVSIWGTDDNGRPAELCCDSHKKHVDAQGYLTLEFFTVPNGGTINLCTYTIEDVEIETPPVIPPPPTQPAPLALTNAGTASLNAGLSGSNLYTVEWDAGNVVPLVDGVTLTNNYAAYTGDAIIDGDLAALTTLTLNGEWSFSTLDTQQFPNLIDLRLSDTYGDNIISGDILDFNRNLTAVRVYGRNTVNGNLGDAPPNIDTLVMAGNFTSVGGLYDNGPSTLTKLTLLGVTDLSGDIANGSPVLERLIVNGVSTLGGLIDGLGPNVVELNLKGNVTVSGNIHNTPSLLATMIVWGNNTVAGNIDGAPNTLKTIDVRGNSAIAGNIGGSPTALQFLRLLSPNTVVGGDIGLMNCSNLREVRLEGGNNTVFGDIGAMFTSCPLASRISIEGNNQIKYTTRVGGNRTWKSVDIISPVSTLTSAEVDNLLIDLSAATNTWQNPKTVTLTGSAAARTTASDAAVAALQADGVTVQTN